MKNLRHLKIYLLLFFLSILLLSCEKEVERPSSEFQFNTIVVESILTNEFKQQKVLLSKPNPIQNHNNTSVSNANVRVFNGTHNFLFIESETERGSYYSVEEFAASISQTYSLDITYEDKQYTAGTTITAVSNYNPLDVVPASDSSYKLSTPTSSYNPNEQAMYEINISWFADTQIQRKTYRYQLSTLDVSIVFSPEEQNIIFPKGTQIIGKKYSLTDDYATYIRAMLAETHWQGGLFDDEKADLPTNISNGGIGYFTACSVIVDTLIVE
jgi:hypothetical protein